MAHPRQVRCLLKMVILASAVLFGGAAIGASSPHGHRLSPAYRHGFLLRRALLLQGGVIAPPALAPEGPGFLPPLAPLPEPSPLPGLAYPRQSPPLPGGMAITINKILSDKTDHDHRDAAQTIGLPRQAAQQLAACWEPPLPQQGDTVEVTLRFGFNSSGSVQWPPRITYLKPGQGMSARDVRESIFSALKACTPLHFSESMAASMPGYPLSVRFIGRRGGDDGGGR